jgi:hypothetical protein
MDPKNPPAVVKEAVRNYVPRAGFQRIPPTDAETSFIFKWGVRVQCVVDDQNEVVLPGAPVRGNITTQIGWVCLADAACRSGVAYLLLSGGRTSKATRHLSEIHEIVSEKVQVEINKKRSREEEAKKVMNSQIYQVSPARARVLLETLLIVYNNLPFRHGEYNESLLLNDVAIKENLQVPIVSSAKVTHSIAELYLSTKKEIQCFLKEHRVADVPCFTMVPDFWTPQGGHTKYFALRVYLITNDWQFKSILLGTRKFDPPYGDRELTIRVPLRRWILRLLSDFDLNENDFYGCTSDGGSDLKWMTGRGLSLKWQWCLPHLTHAATKGAFGMTNSEDNQEMANLTKRITATVLKVQKVERMGDLFASLVEASRKPTKCRGLVTFRYDIVSVY